MCVPASTVSPSKWINAAESNRPWNVNPRRTVALTLRTLAPRKDVQSHRNPDARSDRLVAPVPSAVPEADRFGFRVCHPMVAAVLRFDFQSTKRRSALNGTQLVLVTPVRCQDVIAKSAFRLPGPGVVASLFSELLQQIMFIVADIDFPQFGDTLLAPLFDRCRNGEGTTDDRVRVLLCHAIDGQGIAIGATRRLNSRS